jgi:hypothetical protein
MDLLTTCTHYSEPRVITTLSLISTLHKSQAHAKSSQSSADFSWQRLLTMEIRMLPALRSSCLSLPCAAVILFITLIPRRGPHRKLRSIVACVLVSAGSCLPSRCLETAVYLFACCKQRLYSFVSRSLPSNGSIRHCIFRCIYLIEREL